MDTFQKRYLEHRANKSDELLKLMKSRHSDRIFSGKNITQDELDYIWESINCVPSSCNRHAVSVVTITDRDRKELLGGILVGGVGWIHRAPMIVLLLADESAYRERINFMPYLDGGVIVQQLYLACTSLGLRCCYCNPNIRNEFKYIFEDQFSKNIFLGAMAIGR